MEEVRWAQAIIGNPSSEAVKGSENLEFLQLSSAGCENYVKDGVLSERIILANATGTYGPSIGEYMVAVTLMHFRKLHFYRDQQKAHLWNNLGRSQSAESAAVLVVGAGDIGGNYARRMKALGSHTIGIRRTSGPNDKPDCFDELFFHGAPGCADSSRQCRRALPSQHPSDHRDHGRPAAWRLWRRIPF